MMRDDRHLTDEELLCAADGELTERRMAAVREHLSACWTCRARLGRFERTIADFVESRGAAGDPLPPPGRSRARLIERVGVQAGRRASLGAVLLALILPVLFLLSRTTAEADSIAIPDPRLTPGATLPVTREDICAAGAVETVRMVPTRVALTVFAAYGIRQPRPRAYEVDYLITPALGGSDNLRNFWPHSYRNTVWNAHIKDALEDHLHGLVCAGKLDLAVAQREIARDWIAAYKKYFRTETPLAEHAGFLKDRPWE